MTAYAASKDGTRIAFSKSGAGPPLILVDGALCHRNFGANQHLPSKLKDHFTVYAYDRRGRGESENNLPYAPQKEWQDLDAIIQSAGGQAYVYGISSGASLAMDAAQSGVKISKIAVYEAPYITDDSRPPLGPDFLSKVQGFVDQDQPQRAASYFLRAGIGLPAILVWILRVFPAWKSMKHLAHTLPYDIQLLGEAASGNPLNPRRWNQVQSPTLVMAGTKSPVWMQSSMAHWAQVLPHAQHLSLSGQDHRVSPEQMADILIQWFQTP